jgi:two-component system, cell cycle sensor histidine kinase and response regulator CckA
MKRFYSSIIGFIIGAVFLCFLAMFQKISIGAPLVTQGFFIPLLFGGISGLLIALWNSKLRRTAFKLKKSHDYLEQRVNERTVELSKTNETLNREIAERKEAEAALRVNEEKFRTIADFTYDWEYWITPDGHHIYVSPSCKRISGYAVEDFQSNPGLMMEIIHPDDREKVAEHHHELNEAGDISPLEFRIITKDGNERWIGHTCQEIHNLDGRFLGHRGSNRDITDQKKMQEELLKARKLESLGVLAGGIAHDFNNLMSAVVGYISLVKMEITPGSKAFENLVKAEKASNQTRALTARLITFSEGGGPIKETASTCNFVKDAVRSSLKGSDINCELSIPDDIAPTEIDEEQMKQVIRNIITNAQEAIAGQGTIRVSCENVDIREKNTLTLKDGKYIKISIRDQGPGISEEDLLRIFDPYFSIKDMGAQKGMGLGLAVAHSIVQKHGGLITVESNLGSGSTFHIYLPAGSTESKAESAERDGIAAQSTIQRVLVMDDEEVVRDISNALLSHLGYEAELAVEGVEAIEMYRKAMASEKPFDMVILDLTNKAGMGGAETMVKLLEIDPDIKAIVATGYANDPIITNFREYGFRGALPKPFTLDQLRTALHDALPSTL